jgi:hypothetical protein
MFEEFMTGETKRFLERKYKLKTARDNELQQMISIKKETLTKTRYLLKTLLPIFNEFYDFIKSKDVDCVINYKNYDSYTDYELENGVDISISISCKFECERGCKLSNRMSCHECDSFPEIHFSIPDYKSVDEISFYMKYGLDINRFMCKKDFFEKRRGDNGISHYGLNKEDFNLLCRSAPGGDINYVIDYPKLTRSCVHRIFDKIKISDINNEIILQKLFFWFNELVKNKDLTV